MVQILYKTDTKKSLRSRVFRTNDVSAASRRFYAEREDNTWEIVKVVRWKEE